MATGTKLLITKVYATVSSSTVNPVGDRFNVGWSHAGTDSAKVVALTSFRDNATARNKGNAVCGVKVSANTELPITILI